jgi:transcriptional regulator with XRE-family HTH domain
MVGPEDGAGLADRLKELRERSWPTAALTQKQLGAVFRVSGATISAWESATNPKEPTAIRLEAYARFFATPRSLDGPRLVPEAELTAEERNRYEELEEELLGLLNATSTALPEPVPAPVDVGSTSTLGRTFTFADGPVTVVCPETPGEARGPLAREKDPNFTKLQQYGDLDALIEMYGHLRAANPTLDVFHRHAGEVGADDLSSHVILLGGITWNQVTKRFQDAISQVPITQIDVADYSDGDVFEIADGGDTDGRDSHRDGGAGDDAGAGGDSEDSDGEGTAERFYPEWEDDDHGNRDLVEDVALIVRLPNPFNGKRTLTICNGVHSRGVYGAVRCLTDQRVREANEEYLADRFPSGRFALLLRVPVVANETMSPDLQNPSARLYEWPPLPGEQG